MHPSKDPKPAPSIVPDPQLYTVRGFCQVHHVCRSTLYGLWENGQGPESFYVGRRRLISGKAAQAWRKKLEEKA